MSVPFSQTVRALQADRFRRPALLLALGLLMLGGWSGWLMLARVSVYVFSESARLEVDRAAHFIEAPMAGQIVAADAALGQPVEAGTILFMLEAEHTALKQEEARAHLGALDAQHKALLRRLKASRRALHQARQAGDALRDKAWAEYEEATSAAQLAEAEVMRLHPLYEKQYVSAADYERQQAEVRQKRAAAEALRQHLRHLEFSQQQEASDRRAELEELDRERARLEGEAAMTENIITQLAHAVEESQIRAPATGHIGELAELRVGAFVEAGERLGAIVPEGQLRAVAYFTPSDAVGRLLPGQTARLRLDGFPWAQYGSVAATVERVATEVQAGRVRVELRLAPRAASHLPLQHGLPGRLEVEVERTAPLALLLRHVGKTL